jgi:hypothetical protein
VTFMYQQLDASPDPIKAVKFAVLRTAGEFVCNAIKRSLAAAYLRSVDPLALFAQRLACRLGLRRVEQSVFEIRVGWRQWFEDKLCSVAQTRILEGIECVLDFYSDMGYLLPPDPISELYSRLMDALCEDAALIAEMGELQKLPISSNAMQQRILAFDAGVEKHMAALAHEVVMGDMAVISGGVR